MVNIPATMRLASHYRELMPVRLGCTLGMVLADGLAVVVAAVAGETLPERRILRRQVGLPGFRRVQGRARAGATRTGR